MTNMDVDYARPSTWVRYTPSLCDGCAADCCRLPVEVTVEDLARLGLLAADEAASPARLRHALKRLVAKGALESLRATGGLFFLKQRDDERCLFLGDDGRCTVYEKRPDTCRRFPAVMGPRIGFCPSKRRSR
jgi:Fe-S-cluster containining protein